MTATGGILHITTVPATLKFLRGAPGYLKARGWAVHVLSAPGAELTEFAQQEGITAHAAPLTRQISPLMDLRALLQIVRVIRAVRPSVVHAHTPKAGLLGMIAATLCRVPIRIYQVRGLPLETASGTLRVVLRMSERVTCALAHRVLAESASLQRIMLAERLCAPDKCTTLLPLSSHGVDAQNGFNPERVPLNIVSLLRTRLGLPSGAPVVGYVGRLARDKGLAELEAAWQVTRRRHPSAQLLLVGGSDVRDPVPADVMNRLRDDPAVHLVGRVEAATPYYALMDVVALPTYREGFPNVPLEAAAMTLPVVATRTTGCVDAVVDGVTGLLVEPRSTVALADALDRYLCDSTLRRRHGLAGRDRVLREFRVEPVWAALHAEYESLARLRSGAPLLRPLNALVKRGFDVLGAALGLVLLAPVMAAVALAVRTRLGAPVLYRQVRAGAHGRPFTLHKFRTMHELRDDNGELLPAAVRLSEFGEWLRSTSLDELPELWDVLRGRMSLVGPRPLLLDYLPLYNA
ncbi:MAG TPA: sugar transferase, partial [Longimicrobiales bacterium]|nr:sugar transferase [Longimicrobiales bacterium]